MLKQFQIVLSREGMCFKLGLLHLPVMVSRPVVVKAALSWVKVQSSLCKNFTSVAADAPVSAW